MGLGKEPGSHCWFNTSKGVIHSLCLSVGRAGGRRLSRRRCLGPPAQHRAQGRRRGGVLPGVSVGSGIRAAG